MTTELLPDKAIYRPDEVITIDVRRCGGHPAGDRRDGPQMLTVWHLGEPVRRHSTRGDGRLTVGPLAPGGYGIEWQDPSGVIARTAVDVHEDPRSRLRYGFVTDFAPDRDATALADQIRRLHLTGIQFYDWAFRHADLLGGGVRYDDPLGRPVSLDTVRALIGVVRSVGAESLGYAAVYGVGAAEWSRWEHRGLLDSTGRAYALGDFLRLVDPAAPDWLAHLAGELARAAQDVGFDGFQLDQYGYPRTAVRVDGTVVDLADSFVALIDSVRATVPRARLVFNNVNDFPTWRTAGARQDAVYVEVWTPQISLGSLASLVTRARPAAGAKPVVVAAYPSVYESAQPEQSDAATALVMATLFSHGAWHILAGDGDRILTDPYFVRNHGTAPTTAALLRRWYDFAVEHDELLFDPEIVDVTASYAGTYNDECDVRPLDNSPGRPPAIDGTSVAETPLAGTVWRRIVRSGDRLILHLINLVDQTDTLWDAPRRATVSHPRLGLRVRRTGSSLPRVWIADPDAVPRLHSVPVHADGTHAVAELPPLGTWLLVLVDPTGGWTEPHGNQESE